MVSNTLAVRSLQVSNATIAQASRRIATGSLTPADNPSGFQMSVARRGDISTSRLAVEAVHRHLGVLDAAATTLVAVSSVLRTLRTDIAAGGPGLSAKGAAATAEVAQMLSGATVNGNAVFSGIAGTARTYQAAVIAVPASPATRGTLTSSVVSLTAPQRSALASSGATLSLLVDGVAKTITLAPGGPYATTDAFASAFVAAAATAGVSMTWSGGRFTATSASTGAASAVTYTSGTAALGFATATAVAGHDAVAEVKAKPEVLARTELPLQFRVVTGRAVAPPVPLPGADPDPDAPYVVPSWQASVSISRVGLDTLGLVGLDASSPGATAKIDAALATINGQLDSYTSSTATLQRIADQATAAADLTEVVDRRAFGVDLAAERYRLAAASMSADVARSVSASYQRSAVSAFTQLLGSLVDIRA